MSRLVFHECLGRGGFGEVYRATWTRRQLENQVAVKVLNASVSEGSDAARRLRDEARLLGALTHPGILRVYDLTEIEGSMAMIAEYVHGEDLDRCVLAGLPTTGMLEVVARVASALAAAWGDISAATGKPLRLVHRDIKPENIRLSPDGNPKLLDFGVARAMELKRDSKTETNTVMGSYRYMSPERFDSSCRPHPSIDVFALGCILYEGLAFKRLFGELSMRQMMMLSVPGSTRMDQHIDGRLNALPGDVDSEVVDLIRRLTHRDPDLRPLPGRLAAMCDDLAEQLPGPSLRQWARGRDWVASNFADGSWTGRSVTLNLKTGDDEDDEEFEESGYPLSNDSLTRDVYIEELPTNDSGLRVAPPVAEPRLAPKGLRFEDTGTVRRPQGRPPEDGPTEEVSADDVVTQAHRLDLATGTPVSVSRAAAPPVQLAEVDTDEQTGDPLSAGTPVSKATPPPAGPEVHREAHERRAQALRNPSRPDPTRAIIANVLALVVLLLLGMTGLLLAALFA